LVNQTQIGVRSLILIFNSFLISIRPIVDYLASQQTLRLISSVLKKMNIRVAELEDLETVVEIYNQAIAAGEKTADITPFSLDDRKSWFSGHAPDKYPILVAEEDGSVVGYLTVSAYRPGRMAVRHTAEVSFFIHFDHHHG
jgi:hypothetical protein